MFTLLYVLCCTVFTHHMPWEVCRLTCLMEWPGFLPHPLISSLHCFLLTLPPELQIRLTLCCRFIYFSTVSSAKPRHSNSFKLQSEMSILQDPPHHTTETVNAIFLSKIKIQFLWKWKFRENYEKKAQFWDLILTTRKICLQLKSRRKVTVIWEFDSAPRIRKENIKICGGKLDMIDLMIQGERKNSSEKTNEIINCKWPQKGVKEKQVHHQIYNQK